MTVPSSPAPALLAGLRKALARPLPLQIKGPAEGLFPAGAAGKPHAELAKKEGWVEEIKEVQQVTKTTKKKTTTLSKEVVLGWGLTPAGRKYLAEADSPKSVLESLRPALQNIGQPPAPPDPEAFRVELEKATATCLGAIREAFGGLQREVLRVLAPSANGKADPAPVLELLEAVLKKVEPVADPTSPPAALAGPIPPPPAHPPAPPSPPIPNHKVIGDEIVSLVDRSQRERSVGCDFAELYEALTRDHPGLSIGEFQDTLRTLDEADRIRLGGWSRMLDDMPRPELALFVSTKVMYHAHPVH